MPEAFKKLQNSLRATKKERSKEKRSGGEACYKLSILLAFAGNYLIKKFSCKMTFAATGSQSSNPKSRECPLISPWPEEQGFFPAFWPYPCKSAALSLAAHATDFLVWLPGEEPRQDMYSHKDRNQCIDPD